MSGGINLHNVVRSAITAIHPDETVTLYRSAGQTNVAGVVTAKYEEPETVMAQIQSSNNADLKLLNNVSQSTIVMRFYLFADPPLPPSGLVRPLVRTGDLIKRANGTWWLVTAKPEDFIHVGWVLVLGTLQELPPEGIEEEVENPDEPE